MTAAVTHWRWALARHVAFLDRPFLRKEGVRGLLDLTKEEREESTWLISPEAPGSGSEDGHWRDIFKDIETECTPPATKTAGKVPSARLSSCTSPMQSNQQQRQPPSQLPLVGRTTEMKKKSNLPKSKLPSSSSLSPSAVAPKSTSAGTTARTALAVHKVPALCFKLRRCDSPYLDLSLRNDDDQLKKLCKAEGMEGHEECENPYSWLLETPGCPEGFKRINGMLMFKDCLGDDHCLSARYPIKKSIKSSLS